MESIGDILKKPDWQTANQPVSKPSLLCYPDCEVCGGVGNIRYDVPLDDPRFGKAFPCPNLPPESSMFQNHGLTVQEIKSFSWSDITPRENVMGALKEIRKLFERGAGMGYFYGGPGLAKTRLLQIFCAQWAREGRGLFHFTTQKDILDDLRVAFDDDEPQRAIRDKQNKYIDYPVLAIDELTLERNTEFKIEQFFHIVNKRHESGTERGMGYVTIMAGNVAPEDLDFRVMDRLTDGDNFIYKLTGESFRPNMRRY